MRYRPIYAAAGLLVSWLLGCERDAAPTPAVVSPSVAPALAESDKEQTPTEDKGARQGRGARAHRAARCGECHEKMYREWRESPHAQTSDSELYRALRKTSDASCDRCHEPLRTLGTSAELARSEGVSCDVCHRIDRVTVRPGHADAPLHAAGNTKFGPRCDARSPYFHKTQCSPLFAESELCAACHLLSVPDANGELLPVHSEYSDWLKGPYPARGKTCQSCHMLPGVTAELATGEPERDDVPDHGFWGRLGELRGTALRAHAQASWNRDAVVVKVNVENVGAGHFMPAGAPGRQIVLRATFLGASGDEIAVQERVFQRRLEDPEGNVGSLTTAARVKNDTRIGPLATRREVFELKAPDASAVRLVLARRSDPELAARLKVEVSPEQSLASVVLALRSSDGSRRTGTGRTALAR